MCISCASCVYVAYVQGLRAAYGLKPATRGVVCVVVRPDAERAALQSLVYVYYSVPSLPTLVVCSFVVPDFGVCAALSLALCATVTSSWLPARTSTPMRHRVRLMLSAVTLMSCCCSRAVSISLQSLLSCRSSAPSSSLTRCVPVAVAGGCHVRSSFAECVCIGGSGEAPCGHTEVFQGPTGCSGTRC